MFETTTGIQEITLISTLMGTLVDTAAIFYMLKVCMQMIFWFKKPGKFSEIQTVNLVELRCTLHY